MPTYEYACRECGQHLEVVQSFRDDPLTVCPSCTGQLRKVYGAAGIIFKGSGYYVNDSRKSSAKGADAGAKKSDAKEGASVSASSDGGGGGGGASEPAGGDAKGDGGAKKKSASSTADAPSAKSA